MHWAESDSSIHWIEGFKLILNNLYFQKRRAPGLWNPGAFSPPRSYNNRVYWPANGLSGMGAWVWWKRTKSRGRGCEDWSPFVSRRMGIKPKTSFRHYPHSLLTVARCARHSHPSPPEEKAASRKKSRLRRKKTAPNAKNGASCVSRVSCLYLWAGIVWGCVLNVRV